MAIPAPTRRSRRGSGAVTLHDVAKLAGVAPITASRALNTPDQVSTEVLKKVGDAIARTGYVPNLLAGGLASTRSRLVAAVVPTISGSVFLESVQAMTEALAESGYQMMLGQAGYAGSREDALDHAFAMHLEDATCGKAAHQGLAHLGRVGAGLAGKDQGFTNRRNVERDDDLVGDLCRLAVAVAADQGDVFAHQFEQRLDQVEGRLGATDHDGQ